MTVPFAMTQPCLFELAGINNLVQEWQRKKTNKHKHINTKINKPNKQTINQTKINTKYTKINKTNAKQKQAQHKKHHLFLFIFPLSFSFFLAWFVNRATAGYVEYYEHFSYATIKGAG